MRDLQITNQSEDDIKLIFGDPCTQWSNIAVL